MTALPNIDQELLDKVDDEYRPTLKHLEEHKPKILVLFLALQALAKVE